MKLNETCKGLVFKAYINAYVNRAGDYVHTERIRLMRKQSCKCNRCQIQFDVYLESLGCSLFPIIDEPLVDQALYGLVVVNESRDYETGIVDNYDFKFIPL